MKINEYEYILFNIDNLLEIIKNQDSFSREDIDKNFIYVLKKFKKILSSNLKKISKLDL